MNTVAQTSPAAAAGWDLGAMYGAIAELLLNPEVREAERVERHLANIPPTPVRERVERFMASTAAYDVNEYTQTLELTPPCPLYLGAHMYDEPSSCRGAGACGRNQYMIELKAMYEHFGFSLEEVELPDFLPVMLEFLSVAIALPERDGIGLRRRFVEQYLQPGIPHLRKSMQKYESVYDLLLEALELVAEEDMERLADDPIWLAPEVKATIPVRIGTSAGSGSALDATGGPAGAHNSGWGSGVNGGTIGGSGSADALAAAHPVPENRLSGVW